MHFVSLQMYFLLYDIMCVYMDAPPPLLSTLLLVVCSSLGGIHTSSKRAPVITRPRIGRGDVGFRQWKGGGTWGGTVPLCFWGERDEGRKLQRTNRPL